VVPLVPPREKALVPEILYFDNDRHTRVLCAMLQDYVLGQHLLLIGNQGVGKNKLADRFLQLLKKVLLP
jgi:MoxR-like ATPase